MEEQSVPSMTAQEALEALRELFTQVQELAEDAHSLWGPELYDAEVIRERFPEPLLQRCAEALQVLESARPSRVSPTSRMTIE